MSERHERLRQARQNAGFAHASDAAKRFGWAAPTYSSHENGHRGLTPDVIETYAAAFRVPVEWLLSGQGDPDFNGMAEAAPPPMTANQLVNLPRPGLNQTNFEVKDGVVELIAVANLKGIAQLRRYLDLIEAALSDAEANH
jgi:transcriptional regulator with XRE-family HTH domain